MYNVHLTHSLLCFEFVEFTLYYELPNSFLLKKTTHKRYSCKDTIKHEMHIHRSVVNAVLYRNAV